jgi:pyruvate formate lyase activating enzyme
VVSGVNDSEEILQAICEIVNSLGPKVRYELMPFHTLGFGKYADLGIENPMEGVKDYDSGRFAELKEFIKQYGY